MTWRFGGADVAHYQDEAGALIDFDALFAGSLDSYFATKGTQRHNYLDPTMARHRAEAQRCGFRHVPIYHWQSPVVEASIQAQASFWIDKVGRSMRIGEAFMADSEQYGIHEPETYELLNLVEDFTRRPSIVYLGVYTDNGLIYKSDRIRQSRFGPRAIHLAAYTTQASLQATKIRLGIQQLEDHANQFGSSGILPSGLHVPGVVGRCDMNQINNRSVFDACCGYTTTTIPTTGEQIMYIVRNAETVDGFEPGVVKYAYDPATGTLRHLTETDLKAAGITNSATLGEPLSNAEIAELGAHQAAGATGPISLNVSLSGSLSGTASSK